MCLHNVNIFKSLKRLGVKQKYTAEKKYFEILRWPFLTFNALWGHTWFYEKFVSSRYDGVFFVRHRRTYVLNNITQADISESLKLFTYNKITKDMIVLASTVHLTC